jgi:beta-mannosidase
VTASALPLSAGWELAGLPPGAVADPAGLTAAGAQWIPAGVPGTVAGALTAAGRRVDAADLDGLDWWFRGRFSLPARPARLELGGIATLGDVWVDGNHVLRTENMHRSYSVDLPSAGDMTDVVVRCGALAPVLAERRARPRWKTYLVGHQQLRWIRTSLLGRIPGWAVVPPPVGLWRPVVLRAADGSEPTGVRLSARCEGGGGVVEATFELRGTRGPGGARGPAQLRVGTATAPLSVSETSGGFELRGAVAVPKVERWWPHTHGPQPLYDVWAEVGERLHRLGRVGFRTVAADRADGGFRLVVNGEPIFTRGACWLPPDPVALSTDAGTEAHLLGLAKAAGMNMVRIPGTTVYESPRFFDRCDELGILVWQDCMFAFMDPPADDAFAEEAEAEVSAALGALGGRPSVAVVCGNQEVEEVAAMSGLEAERRATPLFDKTLADVAAAVLPGVPYVASNPTGGDQPFRMDRGVSQYFGVGGYLRPVDDARAAGVRFAAECLAFATPPEPETVDALCGGAWRAGHDPSWKAGVHHDAGRSWDMEDVRDHYVASLFGTDARRERYVDPERALELGRAVNARLMEAVFSEWRRPGSPCAGGLVLALADLRPGAGWGLVDAAGRPKAPWYSLRRVLQPVALLAVDEGLNGLDLHVVNDTPRTVRARLALELVAHGSVVVEHGEVAVEVAGRSSWSVDAEEVLGAWRDVTYAYRFAPPGHDAVVATLRAEDGPDAGGVIAQVVYLPLGQARAVEPDLGLAATARRTGDGGWSVEVRTRRLAQWVSIRAAGFVAADSWFHLPPGGSRLVELWPEIGGRVPSPAGAAPGDIAPVGTVSAINASASVPITAPQP